MSGFFISFEGGDGAGKTTQAALLAEWIEREYGLEVIRTREPGGTELGRTLRQLLLHGDSLDPRTEALLFAADRADHVARLIRPALNRGAVVITDRYVDSSLAYQAGGRELSDEQILALSRFATDSLMPALTVLLDLAPEAMAERIRQASRPVPAGRSESEPAGGDRMESAGLEFHRRTRAAFLARAAAEPRRFFTLDAADTPEAIHTRIRGRVRELLGERP